MEIVLMIYKLIMVFLMALSMHNDSPYTMIFLGIITLISVQGVTYSEIKKISEKQ